MATGRVPTTANSPLTAKGDLFAYSTAPARLAVGNDGEQIVADSSTATGLKWAAPSAGSSYVAGKNALFNSAFDIWQRGTSSTGTAYNYTADRWLNFRGAFAAGATFSRIASTQTGFQYALRAQRNSGNTATDVLHLRQGLETNDSLRFQGQTVTVSFYARAGANFSATSSILVSTIYQGEGTDQATDNMTGWTGVTAIAQNNTLTTSWQRFSQTTTISSAKTQFGIAFTYTPTGTAGAADNYDITGVQVEIASTASAFSRQTGSIQGELAACQRYFYKANSGTTFTEPWIGFFTTSSKYIFNVYFPVSMRVTPTLTTTSGSDYYFLYQNGGAQYFSAVALESANFAGAVLRNSGTPSLSGSVGQSWATGTSNSASSVSFSAEL